MKWYNVIYKGFCFFVLLNSLQLNAQNQFKIDSLQKVVLNAKNDSVKLAVNNQIVWQYLFTDAAKAWKYIQLSEKIALKPHNQYGYISLVNIKGIYYDVNGNSDSALYFFKQALSLSIKYKIPDHQEHSINNLGMYFWNQGKLEQALQYFFKALRLNQQIHGIENDKKDAMLNNIGLIYQEQDLYAKALTYHLQAYAIRKKREPAASLNASLCNLGVCYIKLDKIDSAKIVLNKCIALRNRVNDESGYYKAIRSLATCYFREGNNKKALALNLVSLNRPAQVPFTDLEKARNMHDIAAIYLQLKKADSSIMYCLKAQKIINADTAMMLMVPESYQTLSNAYALNGDIHNSLLMSSKFLEIAQQKYSQQGLKSLQEIEEKYQSEVKDKKLLNAKLQIANETKKRNLIIAGGLLLSMVLFVFWNAQRLSNKRLKLEQQLNKAIMDVQMQNELQQQRLAISNDLHDNIGSQLTFIISTLNNLKIFDLNDSKIHAKFDQLSDFTKQTIAELRDTIWALNKENISMHDLHVRILNFISKAENAVSSTEFQFNYPTNQELVFDAKKGIDLFRIIQEAVNNAIKHANASQIQVNLLQYQPLHIQIVDNGIGFDFETAKRSHGLDSMNKRAEQIQAKIEWKSNANGTQIDIVEILNQNN